MPRETNVDPALAIRVIARESNMSPKTTAEPIDMVDSTKRDELIQRIQAQPEHQEGRALVTLAEFFEGNDDLGSIGCNLTDHPGLDHFRQVLSDFGADPMSNKSGCKSTTSRKEIGRSPRTS